MGYIKLIVRKWCNFWDKFQSVTMGGNDYDWVNVKVAGRLLYLLLFNILSLNLFYLSALITELLFFYCLNALVGPLEKVLNNGCGNGYLCLIPDFNGITFITDCGVVTSGSRHLKKMSYF